MVGTLIAHSSPLGNSSGETAPSVTDADLMVAPGGRDTPDLAWDEPPITWCVMEVAIAVAPPLVTSR
ncbi:hypothetical protein ACGFYT_29085 [Streptomyces sp. NPDC048208]|uniref:hypothetical protein n=1 Tax=Streptomyces sp. NPDC048208 TaxID=3365515 RepID=UPI003712E44B